MVDSTSKNTMVHIQKHGNEMEPFVSCNCNSECLPCLDTTLFAWYSKVIQCICPQNIVLAWHHVKNLQNQKVLLWYHGKMMVSDGNNST